MAENVLFGAEFDGKPIVDGVNEVVVKLAELKQGLKEIREEQARLNKALDDNQKELAETQKALDLATKAGDPKKVKELSDQIAVLTAREKELSTALKEANVQQVVLQKGAALYNKEINETVRNNRSAREEIGKFTSVTRLAGEAVGRLRTFVTEAAFGLVSGFAGGIIASVLPAITSWIAKLIEANTHVDALKRKQELQNEVVENAAKSVAGQVVKLEAYRKILNDLTVPESERLRVAKEFNKTADEKNQIDTTQISNLGEINKLLDQQKEKLIQVALANAGVAKVAEAAQPFIELDLKLRLAAQGLGISEELLKSNLKLFGQIRDQAIETGQKARVGSIFTPEDAKRLNDFAKSLGVSREQLGKLLDVSKEATKAKKNLDDVTAALQDLITAGGITPSNDTNGPVNVFLRELARVQDAVKQFNAQKFPSEANIIGSFQSALEKQLLDIDKFLDKKSHEQLTKKQADFLKGLLTGLTEDQQNQALEEFRRKVQDLNDKLNDAIEGARIDEANKRIANIRDDNEREKQQIEQGYLNTLSNLRKAEANLIKQVDEDVKQGLDPAIAQRKKFGIRLIFGDLADQAETKRGQDLSDNAFKTFQKTVKDSNEFFEEQLTEVDVNIAARIVKEKDALAAGTISYKKFQENVTALLKQQKAERDQIRKAELEADLQQINVRINATTDPEQLAQLRAQAREIKDQIAAIDSNTEQQKEDPLKKRTENLVKYAQSVQQVLGSVIGFWQQLNAQEQKSLDQSINLQKKRVEEATRIAERGNAEFLNEEQDRLDQLELKREASARKQQAINSALVLSNALVATVSAIAQAASTSGPAAPFAAIAAGIAVIGAITAAFQFVQSLQPPVANFYKGTEEVTLGGNKPGIDTVPARLTAGERVVTAKENKDYFATLSAIHNRKVSPEILNSFVRQTLTGQNFSQKEIWKEGKQTERVRETVLKGVQERHFKDREHFTEKIHSQSREAKLQERNLIREITEMVSSRIQNNQDKKEILFHVERFLQSKLETRPVLVPQIMKLITDRVNTKESSNVTTNLKEVNYVLESFSDRITERFMTRRFRRTFHERESDKLVENLATLVDTKDTKDSMQMIREQLTDRLNVQDSKVVIPYILEKLTERIQAGKEVINKDGKDTKDTVKESIKEFARGMNERVMDSKTREVVRELSRVMDEHHVENVEKLLTEKLYNTETAQQLIPLISKELRNNIENKTLEHADVKNTDKVKEVFTSNNRSNEVNRILDRSDSSNVRIVDNIILRYSDRVNQVERDRVANYFHQESFLKANREYQETIHAILEKRIDPVLVNQFVKENTRTETGQTKLERLVEVSRQLTREVNNTRNGMQTTTETVLKYARPDVPVVNIKRLEHATATNTEMKGMLAEQIRVLKENVELQRENNRLLKAFKFDFTFDKHGVTAMLMQGIEQKKIDLKS